MSSNATPLNNNNPLTRLSAAAPGPALGSDSRTRHTAALGSSGAALLSLASDHMSITPFSLTVPPGSLGNGVHGLNVNAVTAPLVLGYPLVRRPMSNTWFHRLPGPQ